MSPLREAVLVQMRLRGFADPTVESYIHALEQLALYYWRPLDQLTCAQVQTFLDHLIRIRRLAWATVNVYFSAYRFLYEQVLCNPPHLDPAPETALSRALHCTRRRVEGILAAVGSVSRQMALS